MLTRTVQPVFWLVVRQQCRRFPAPRFNSSHGASSSSGVHHTSTTSTLGTEQGYLTDERKRHLITLYHRAEKFVTLENLSDYIDREFDRTVSNSEAGSDSVQFEDDRHLLDGDLLRRERRAKYSVTSEGDGEYERMDANAFRKLELRHRDMARASRLKAAVYKVDETMKAGLEMVEEYRRRGSVDAFGKPSE